LTNLLNLLRSRLREQRYSVDDWVQQFSFNGHSYPLVGLSASSDREDIENSFTGYVQGVYKSNGVVFAVVLARMLLFAEARFQWQQMRGGRPGDLFGTDTLSILERPWPNGTTGELLARMEQDVSLAGNCYIARERRRLRRLRPDWVTIVLTEPPDEAIESDVAGYLYTPGGPMTKAEPKLYLPHELAHWSPIPDPEAQYRGMSWLTPVIREIQADKSATLHKKRFFDNAATPNLAVSFKETVTKEQFTQFIETMNSAHQGANNAYKTLYLGGGADVTVVGADLKQLDFKATQGAGETRIAAAGGVPPIIVGLSEGLGAATYSNYSSARRKFGDSWGRPQWRSACAALQTIAPPPAGARLWVDLRDVAFLREDQKDAAEIGQTKASTIRSYIDAGFEPSSAVAAVMADDQTLLVHTGLYSVQLQPPGSGVASDEKPPNGDAEEGDGDEDS
jgi:phage portal protein BeeE